MKKSIIYIKKMDCPSEIKMIEGLFENLDSSIKISFNLSSRECEFYHNNKSETILERLGTIGLPGVLVSDEEIKEDNIPNISQSVESKTLRYLLIINFSMFIVEILFGLYAQSTGLIADGLDMLADSFVYAISLYAVGKAISTKTKAAKSSGIMQITLGLLCLFEVARKFIYGSEPISSLMIIVSVCALIANVVCLALIHKHKDGEIHMKASWIFSANDVIVNVGVIVSGACVYFFDSNIPDLLIGGFVSFVVIKGGVSIIKMSNIK